MNIFSFITAAIIEMGSIAFFLMWRSSILQIKNKKAGQNVLMKIDIPVFVQHILFLPSGKYEISFFVVFTALISELFAVTTSISFIVYFFSETVFWLYVGCYGIATATIFIIYIILLLYFALHKKNDMR